MLNRTYKQKGRCGRWTYLQTINKQLNCIWFPCHTIRLSKHA